MTTEAPVGIHVHQNKPCLQERDNVVNLIEKFLSLNEQQVEIAEKFHFKQSHSIRLLQVRKESLDRCVALEEEFRVVTIDESAKRKIKYIHGDEDRSVEVPLIWRTKLPASPMSTLRVNSCDCSCITPRATPEAMEALEKHKDKFDWVELWWVPKHVQVSQRPSRPAPADPDPILVGCVETNENDTKYYFELHRWVDELVERGWWSQEAY